MVNPAKKPQKSDADREIRFTVSAQFWDYLDWLISNTVLGKSRNDIAQHILTERLTQMRDENYKDKLKP